MFENVLRIYTVSAVYKTDKGLVREHKMSFATNPRKTYSAGELAQLVADALAESGKTLTDTEMQTLIVRDRKTKSFLAFKTGDIS
jgi:hypothetical protein